MERCLCAFLLFSRLRDCLPLSLPPVPDAPAQSGSFTVSQHGKAVGTASFNFTATPHGYDSTSLVRVAMQGLDYALSKDRTALLSQPAQACAAERHVNGSAVNVTAAPDSAQILINISANGTQFDHAPGRASGRCLPARLRPRRTGDSAGSGRHPQQPRPVGHHSQAGRLG